MADQTQSLLFIKGLRENPEYVDENGIRELINIWREVWNGDLEERVIIGTDYADGAFSSLEALLEERRDLFEKMEQEFIDLYQSDEEDYIKSPARTVLEELGKLPD